MKAGLSRYGFCSRLVASTQKLLYEEYIAPAPTLPSVRSASAALLTAASVRRDTPTFTGVRGCGCRLGAKVAGMDGNRTHPGRLSSAPQTVLKTAGGTSPRTSPAGKMLFRQRDADALDSERFCMAGQQADQEAQHAIDLGGPCDGGNQRGLR